MGNSLSANIYYVNFCLCIIKSYAAELNILIFRKFKNVKIPSNVYFFQIFLRIKDSDSEHPDMLAAKELIRRIMKREFYKSLRTINITKDHLLQEKNPKELENELRAVIQKEGVILKPEEIMVSLIFMLKIKYIVKMF